MALKHFIGNAIIVPASWSENEDKLSDMFVFFKIEVAEQECFEGKKTTNSIDRCRALGIHYVYEEQILKAILQFEIKNGNRF